MNFESNDNHDASPRMSDLKGEDSLDCPAITVSMTIMGNGSHNLSRLSVFNAKEKCHINIGRFKNKR